MPSIITDRYKDLDISFRKNPATDDIYELKDIEAVKRSVKILVLTQFNEVPFHPEIGSSVYSSLFENYTQETTLILDRTIREVIRKYEPRATVQEVKIIGRPDNNSIEISILFYIQNIEELQSVSVKLERIR